MTFVRTHYLESELLKKVHVAYPSLSLVRVAELEYELGIKPEKVGPVKRYTVKDADNIFAAIAKEQCTSAEKAVEQQG